jgi:hypothetical protein
MQRKNDLRDNANGVATSVIKGKINGIVKLRAHVTIGGLKFLGAGQ